MLAVSLSRIAQLHHLISYVLATSLHDFVGDDQLRLVELFLEIFHLSQLLVEALYKICNVALQILVEPVPFGQLWQFPV